MLKLIEKNTVFYLFISVLCLEIIHNKYRIDNINGINFNLGIWIVTICILLCIVEQYNTGLKIIKFKVNTFYLLIPLSLSLIIALIFFKPITGYFTYIYLLAILFFATRELDNRYIKYNLKIILYSLIIIQLFTYIFLITNTELVTTETPIRSIINSQNIHRVSSFFQSPGTYGFLSAFVIILSPIILNKNNKLMAFTIIISIISLYLSDSRAAMFSLIITSIIQTIIIRKKIYLLITVISTVLFVLTFSEGGFLHRYNIYKGYLFFGKVNMSEYINNNKSEVIKENINDTIKFVPKVTHGHNFLIDMNIYSINSKKLEKNLFGYILIFLRLLFIIFLFYSFIKCIIEKNEIQICLFLPPILFSLLDFGIVWTHLNIFSLIILIYINGLKK